MKNHTSIDPAEVEKFSKLAEKWWDKNGEFRTLHQINPIRLSYIKDKITQHFGSFPKDVTILDIGCGGGLVSVPLSKIGAKVTGIDASIENIKTAEVYAKKHALSVKYECGSVEEHKGLYDVVLALEIIEHVADAEFFIKSAMALVKPGGMMILSTINRTNKARLMTIGVAEYLLRWLPIGTHEFGKFVKPSEIARFVSDSGMKIQELKGLGYDLFTKSWKLQDNIDVNYFAYLSLGRA